MDPKEVFSWVIEGVILTGIAGGSILLIWYIVKSMITDLRREVKNTVVEMNLNVSQLETRVNGMFREQAVSCADIRGKCMVERDKMKNDYLTEEMHKMVCVATQKTFLLHVSEENKKLAQELTDKIDENRKVVISLINELRKDMKSNGFIKK